MESRESTNRSRGPSWIVFNGAIYKAPELRGDLEKMGERFVTTSDTEVLLAAWIRWGRASLDRLNGMWAFAVWDRKSRRLTCCRDRYGVKPFYWTRDDAGRFAFASEPDDAIVRRYLQTGFTIGGGTSRTVYRNYSSLPEGSLLEISPDGLAETKWYVTTVARSSEPPSLRLPGAQWRLASRLAAAASDEPIDGMCGANPTLRSHLHHQFFLDYLPVVLRFEDRLTMAHGLEARMPFLDYRIVEFLAEISDDWILHRGCAPSTLLA